jgi:hypothetical protein
MRLRAAEQSRRKRSQNSDFDAANGTACEGGEIGLRWVNVSENPFSMPDQIASNRRFFVGVADAALAPTSGRGLLAGAAVAHRGSQRSPKSLCRIRNPAHKKWRGRVSE